MNHSKPPKKLPIPKILALIGSLFAAQATHAGLAISLTSTPLGGGIFDYHYSIANSGPEDLAIVSITDAALGDALIGATLQAPAGFLASYDSSLGFVDFIGDASVFGAGTTIGGFWFQSGVSPQGQFINFEALSITGSLISGNVDLTITPVPEAGTFWAAGLGLVAFVISQRRRSIVQS